MSDAKYFLSQVKHFPGPILLLRPQCTQPLIECCGETWKLYHLKLQVSLSNFQQTNLSGIYDEGKVDHHTSKEYTEESGLGTYGFAVSILL